MRALMLLAPLLLIGCASSQDIPFKVTSDPSGAPVEVNGVRAGETPTSIRWVGLAVAPGGWEYDDKVYNVHIFPPPRYSGEEELMSQNRRVRPASMPDGGKIHADLSLEPRAPTQRIENR